MLGSPASRAVVGGRDPETQEGDGWGGDTGMADVGLPSVPSARRLPGMPPEFRTRHTGRLCEDPSPPCQQAVMKFLNKAKKIKTPPSFIK